VRGPPPAPSPTNDSTQKKKEKELMTETKLPANEEVSRYKEELGL